MAAALLSTAPRPADASSRDRRLEWIVGTVVRNALLLAGPAYTLLRALDPAAAPHSPDSYLWPLFVALGRAEAAHRGLLLDAWDPRTHPIVFHLVCPDDATGDAAEDLLALAAVYREELHAISEPTGGEEETERPARRVRPRTTTGARPGLREPCVVWRGGPDDIRSPDRLAELGDRCGALGHSLVRDLPPACVVFLTPPSVPTALVEFVFEGAYAVRRIDLHPVPAAPTQRQWHAVAARVPLLRQVWLTLYALHTQPCTENALCRADRLPHVALRAVEAEVYPHPFQRAA